MLTSRRAFLAFLAGSPLLAGVSREWLAQNIQGPSLITAAADALDIFDFESVARSKLPPAHWGYLATGTDDDATIQANRDGFKKWALRPRRLIDVTRVDPSIQMLGTNWPTPIVINPVGSQKAFHAQGELAVARAAKTRDHLMVLSTVATSSIEDVTAARGKPIWFQLYHRQDWNETKQMIARAERAGCPALVFTVDLIGGSNRLTMQRAQVVDTRDCIDCHRGGRPKPGLSGLVGVGEDNRRKPMLADLQAGPRSPETTTPTWEFVKRLKTSTSMKVFLKGIVTREDAELAMQHGVDGLFVSNHGGRAEDSGRATILSLPEVLAGVRGRAPVIVDGGIRRGTDIFKAMALGATAVGIGRPYIWGLAAFGQEGVEAVLAILRREFEMVMRQTGAVSVPKITRSYVVPAGT